MDELRWRWTKSRTLTNDIYAHVRSLARSRARALLLNTHNYFKHKTLLQLLFLLSKFSYFTHDSECPNSEKHATQQTWSAILFDVAPYKSQRIGVYLASKLIKCFSSFNLIDVAASTNDQWMVEMSLVITVCWLFIVYNINLSTHTHLIAVRCFFFIISIPVNKIIVRR